ncbi:MAG: hypothetical protein ACI4QI_04895 [Candidatus Coproplasma sp.]
MDSILQTGMGIPATCKVKYDEEAKRLKCYTDRRRLRTCCKIISPDFRLTVLFTVADGKFIGFEYECEPELFPEVSLNKPITIDGYANLKVEPYIKRGYHIISFSNAEAKYDREAKLLLIGDKLDELAFYRVCKNMSFGVNSDGKFCSILIEI